MKVCDVDRGDVDVLEVAITVDHGKPPGAGDGTTPEVLASLDLCAPCRSALIGGGLGLDGLGAKLLPKLRKADRDAKAATDAT